MSGQLKNPAGNDEATPSAEFIAICALAFDASVSATDYFCRSMCCETETTGGWMMSTMWMRMRGQSWVGRLDQPGTRAEPLVGFARVDRLVCVKANTIKPNLV